MGDDEYPAAVAAAEQVVPGILGPAPQVRPTLATMRPASPKVGVPLPRLGAVAGGNLRIVQALPEAVVHLAPPHVPHEVG